MEALTSQFWNPKKGGAQNGQGKRKIILQSLRRGQNRVAIRKGEHGQEEERCCLFALLAVYGRSRQSKSASGYMISVVERWQGKERSIFALLSKEKRRTEGRMPIREREKGKMCQEGGRRVSPSVTGR